MFLGKKVFYGPPPPSSSSESESNPKTLNVDLDSHIPGPDHTGHIIGKCTLLWVLKTKLYTPIHCSCSLPIFCQWIPTCVPVTSLLPPCSLSCASFMFNQKTNYLIQHPLTSLSSPPSCCIPRVSTLNIRVGVLSTVDRSTKSTENIHNLSHMTV